MNKLTFKEYLNSKRLLHEAIANVPIQTREYSIKRYCKLPVDGGDTKVALKPKQKIIIEWRYCDIDNPKPLHVKFCGVRELSEATEFQPAWHSKKLQQWLLKNATERNPFGE